MQLTNTFKAILGVSRHNGMVSDEDLAEILIAAVKERDTEILSQDTPENPLKLPKIIHLMKETL